MMQKTHKKKIFILVVLLLCFPFFLFAQEDDSGSLFSYHLFKPKPKDKMREMHTDRPDVTETPFTVDAGHIQFEFDFLNLYRHPISRQRGETDLLVLNGIAKIGVTDFADLEVVFSANQWHFPDKRKIQNDSVFNRSGFGDIGFRAKFNLLGNSHEQFGIALMPSILLPLNNEASEQVYIPGITAIWAYHFADQWEIGGQLDYYRLFDLSKRPLFNEFWATFEIGYDMSEKFSFFTEYVAILSENNAYLHTYNAGVVYAISSNFRIDLAFNLGLNHKSPSTIFTGFSFRI
ncbi:MAG: transporter [Bernardetiaceae bacterium]|nr:transporter [Bernardetiaceae bacterium]